MPLPEPNVKATAEPGSHWLAVFSYDGGRDGDLSFDKGDIVTVRDGPEGGWWYGELDGSLGWFPQNYVQKSVAPKINAMAARQESTELASRAVHEALSASENIERRTSVMSMNDFIPAQIAELHLDSQKSKAGRPGSPLTASRPGGSPQARRQGTLGPTLSPTTATKRPWYLKYKGISLDRKQPIIGDVRENKQTSPLAALQGWREGLTDAQVAAMSDAEKKLAQAKFELLQSERNYVRDLEVIIQVFMHPLQSQGILSARETQTLFSNIESIYPVNVEILSALERLHEDPAAAESVGQIFLQIVPYFRLYSQYCSSFPYAEEWLRESKSKGFRTYLKSCEKLPVCRQMGLLNFLLVPIQRICKYPLLLREILKYTPDKSKERAELTKALAMVEAVVNIVNEQKRQMEGLANTRAVARLCGERMPKNLVTMNRELVRKQPMMSVNKDGKRKNVMVYFFNDAIMVCKVYKQLLDFRLHPLGQGPMLYKDMAVVEQKAAGPGDFRFVIKSTSDSFTFSVETANDLSAWLKFFRQKIMEEGGGEAARLAKRRQSVKSVASFYFKQDALPAPGIQGLADDDDDDEDTPREIRQPSSSTTIQSDPGETPACGVVVFTTDDVAPSNITAVDKAEVVRLPEEEIAAPQKTYARDVRNLNPEQVHVQQCLPDARDTNRYLYKVVLSPAADDAIYRTYDDFFDLHVLLHALFPEEAGTVEDIEKTLPDLSAAKRVTSLAAAKERTQELDRYLHEVLALPPKISHCSAVNEFFNKSVDYVPELSAPSQAPDAPKLAPRSYLDVLRSGLAK